MSWLIEPLQYSFMRCGLAAAILIGTTCALLGVYVVLRRMAFIGDAIAHSALPGIAIAYFLGLNLVIGAVAAGLVTAFGIGFFARRNAVSEDTAIGILFTGMFALGVFLMSGVKTYRHLSQMLFGNILGVSGQDLIFISVLTVLVAGVLFLCHKELELTTCDPGYAESIGLKTDKVRYILLVLLALAIVAGIQAVGVVLTSALLVTPAASASLFSKRLSTLMPLAVAFACVSSIGGLYLSYYISVASGSAIVLLCTLLFCCSWTINRLRKGAT